MTDQNDREYGELAMLLGGKITHLVHTPEDEDGNIFWGLQIKVGKEKKVIWFLSDFEGNAPGGWNIEEVAQ